jgi:D-alanine-D-alanine ligase-like ATP-grasp enzyme
MTKAPQRPRRRAPPAAWRSFLVRFAWGRRRRAARAFMDTQAGTIERFMRDVYPRLDDPGETVAAGRSYHIGAFREAADHYGLELRRSDDANFELLRDGAVVGRLRGMLTSLVSREAVETCANKARTIALLREAGVPVPRQRQFLSRHADKALAFAAKHDFAVVVKPCYGAGGRGVSTAIADADDFRRAWAHAVDNLPPKRAQVVVVESRCPGMDIRAVVIAGRFSCAATRLPAHVIGDGRSTLAELVAAKNALKSRHIEHGRYPILLDERTTDRLRVAGISPATVVADGRLVVLAEVNNIHLGGESCEITEFLSPRIRTVAEQAARAVPGLAVVGVDLLVTSLDDDAEVVVIEMNPRANLSVHHAPYRGVPQNPARDIVRVMLEQADKGNAPDRVSPP